MVNQFKCDICRIRKVKCDQRKPSCSACSIRNRPCKYRNAPQAQDEGATPSQDGMRLMAARQAPTGSGVYHKLAVRDQSQTLASASWYLSSRETQLASQWVGMTNELSTSWSWFNAFLSSVATFIGSDPALDLAMKFTLHSYADFKKKWHSVYDHSAQMSGMQAMKALRFSINNSSHAENHAQLAIAAGLCSIAEIFRSIGGVLPYFVHLRACAKLTAIHAESLKFGNMNEAIYYMIVFEEVDNSISRGDHSVFEKISLPSFRSLASLWGGDRYTVAVSGTLSLLTQLPRMVLLVRHCDDPSGKIPYVSIFMDFIRWVDEKDNSIKPLVDELGSLIPTKSQLIADILPWSFDFDSAYHYDLALQYYTFKIMFCSLVLAFLKSCEKRHDAPEIELLSVHQAEELNALSLVMCVQFALNSRVKAPGLALRLIPSVKHSYGAWQRIEDRATEKISMDDGTAQKASRIKAHCYACCAEAMHTWGPETPPPESYFRDFCRTAAGGPLMNYVEAIEKLDQNERRRASRKTVADVTS